MFEKIKDQVDDLPSHVDRITRYARLYQTDDMRELLIQCSVNVLKFCIKVWKQFKRHGKHVLLHAFLRPVLTLISRGNPVTFHHPEGCATVRCNGIAAEARREEDG